MKWCKTLIKINCSQLFLTWGSFGKMQTGRCYTSLTAHFTLAYRYNSIHFQFFSHYLIITGPAKFLTAEQMSLIYKCVQSYFDSLDSFFLHSSRQVVYATWIQYMHFLDWVIWVLKVYRVHHFMFSSALSFQYAIINSQFVSNK